MMDHPTLQAVPETNPVAAAATQAVDEAFAAGETTLEPTPVPLTPEQERMDAALKVIDDLREAVTAGRVSAFAGVLLMPNDETGLFVASPSATTRLRMGGAIFALQNAFARNEF